MIIAVNNFTTAAYSIESQMQQAINYQGSTVSSSVAT